jgi:hypothetical protein
MVKREREGGRERERERDVITRPIKLLFMDLKKTQQYDIFHCPSSQTETSKPRLFVLQEEALKVELNHFIRNHIVITVLML